MQKSVLNMIQTLRGEGKLELDTQNQNRYRVLVKEPCGTTAYCFSTPVYELQSRKLVTLQFFPLPEKKGFVFHGSHGCMTVKGNCVKMKNDNGAVKVTLPKEDFSLQEGLLSGKNMELRPTLNGFAITARVAKTPAIKLKLQVDKPCFSIRANEKYFAFMQEEFRPFASLSALYAKGEDMADGSKCYPVLVAYEKLNAQTYTVELSATKGSSLCFEINLYEPKLFQDTTVESRHPEENNAFGSVAFLGRTEAFGEQWLYARPDFSKISEFYRLPVKRVLLHLPKFHQGDAQLSVFVPQARFCSFGSNWQNKIAHGQAVTVSGPGTAYETIDITPLVVSKPEQTLKNTEGMIFKIKEKERGFCVVATGDNYDTPQILEIQYC